MVTHCVILQLAKRLHPDMNKDDPDAEKKFQEVQKAYEVLVTLENFFALYKVVFEVSTVRNFVSKIVYFDVAGSEG